MKTNDAHGPRLELAVVPQHDLATVQGGKGLLFDPKINSARWNNISRALPDPKLNSARWDNIYRAARVLDGLGPR